MEITVRDYEPSDAEQAIAVYRDALDSLRKSKGGSHPDAYIDKLLSASEAEILKTIRYPEHLAVALSNGEIVGIGGLTDRLKNRIMGSTYSCNHYVKKAFQGAGVGTKLKSWTIERAKGLGYRKIYGYSTNEGRRMNEKFGASFFPAFDAFREGSGITVHYYEIHLKKSMLNGLRLEPYLSELSSLSRLLKKIRG